MSLLDVDPKTTRKKINKLISVIEEKKNTFKTTQEIINILKDIDINYNDNIYNFFDNIDDALSLVPKNFKLTIENISKNKLKNELSEKEVFSNFKISITNGTFTKIINKGELCRSIILLSLHAICENLKGHSK